MKNIFRFSVMSIILTLVSVGCSNPAGGGGGGGYSTPIDNTQQAIEKLPSFEGKPVGTEKEAQELAIISMVQI